MDFESIMLAGIPAVILIPKLVNLAKSYGFPDRYVPLLCIGMGVGAVFLADWASRNENVLWALSLSVTGLVMGLFIAGDRSFNNFYERKAAERTLQDEAQEAQTVTTATVTASPSGVSKEVEVMPVAPTLTAGGTPPQGGQL